MRRFLTLYMTANWHREFAMNFATFLKVCRDFFTFAPWFSYSPSHRCCWLKKVGKARSCYFSTDTLYFDRQLQSSDREDHYGCSEFYFLP